jgi:hypothetical protein
MKNDSLKIESRKLDELQPDPKNARKHDKKNLAAIAQSLQKFGQRKPIVITNDGIILAGTGTFEAAQKLNWETIQVTIAPSDWDEATATAYALADNRTSELAAWDVNILTEQLVELQTLDWDIKSLGFEKKDFDLTGTDGVENPYTQKTNIPQYEITGAKPEITELFDPSKSEFLKQTIADANIDADAKTFLLAAAERHVVFDYGKIAEYYAHAPADVQQLMEDSALVIIDIDDAIRNGFVRMSSAMSKLVDELDDYDDQ